MDLVDNLTTEWIADKLQGENQFQIVNHLIKLAHLKVKAGQNDEFAEQQNIALEVIHDVAEGVTESEEEQLSETIQTESVVISV